MILKGIWIHIPFFNEYIEKTKKKCSEYLVVTLWL